MSDYGFTINKFFYFFKRAIWAKGNVGFRENPLVYLAQRLYMVFQGLFVENHWGYAAQLTFNTMMAIIPVFAVIFAVGRGFGFEDYIAEWCRQVFVSQPQVGEAILTLSKSYIGYTHTGVVIGISLVFMLYSGISLFNNIEDVFNGIWAVKKERSFTNAIIDYVSIVFLVPLAIILFSGLSVFFYSILGRLPDFQVLTPMFKALIRFLVPLAVLTLFFTLLYAFLPNTKVRLSMVWFPAMLAGLCIIGLQTVYVHFQVLFTSYSVIYGSLAALPLLMLWMQLSWFICIGFAELGRANQELADGHLGEDRRDSIMEKVRKSGVVLSLLCRRQRQGSGPALTRDLLQQTHYSYAQLMRSLGILIEARLVARTQKEDGTEVYTLNRDGSMLGTGEMVRAVLGRKSPQRDDDPALRISAAAERQIEDMMEEFLKTLDNIKLVELT
ncbi:MAG: YihY/virulence factor BrkB family protein [Prevotella sp.]|nr:YihY/virulence factor BrkB family protein [Prevotella sp.]